MYEERTIEAVASDDFTLIVQNAWAQMFGELDQAKQNAIRNIKLHVAVQPTPIQLAITGTSQGYTLLGMYYQGEITLFEEPIRQAARQYDRPVEDIASEVMRHEIWQHHLGSNHTVRPSAPRSLDKVYRDLDSIPQGGQIPYEYARPARCCPGRGW